jgi:hypothetical protein
MIARVSKNFKGTICIPSVSQKGMTAGETFYMDDATYWKPDVQNALSKRMIVALGEDAPKPQETVYLTNITGGSVTVPGVGVIRAGESQGVSADLAGSQACKELESVRVLKISKREPAPPKRGRGRPRKHPVSESPPAKPRKKDPAEWNPLAWNPLTEDGKRAGKPLPTVLKLNENPKPLNKRAKKDDYLLDPDDDDDDDDDLLIDPGDDDDEEEEDGIVWADRDENKKRIAAHPVLGKKKHANNRKR